VKTKANLRLGSRQLGETFIRLTLGVTAHGELLDTSESFLGAVHVFPDSRSPKENIFSNALYDLKKGDKIIDR